MSKTLKSCETIKIKLVTYSGFEKIIDMYFPCPPTIRVPTLEKMLVAESHITSMPKHTIFYFKYVEIETNIPVYEE